MDSPLVSIALVALGAMLGLVSTLVSAGRQQRQAVTLKLLDEYFAVRRAIVEAVSDLTNIGLQQEMAAPERIQHRDRVAKLFYAHYDYLPKEVLDSMMLLQVCLERPEIGLLGFRGSSIVTADKDRSIRLIEECSLTQNAAFTAALALNCDNRVVRENQALKLHARYVLYTMNRFCSADDLLSMVARFKKSVVGGVTQK